MDKRTNSRYKSRGMQSNLAFVVRNLAVVGK